MAGCKDGKPSLCPGKGAGLLPPGRTEMGKGLHPNLGPDPSQQGSLKPDLGSIIPILGLS